LRVSVVKADNFKNYSSIKLELSDTCNIIYGRNGSGKTNFLDLIHFASIGKSYFTITDKQAIRYDQDYFRVEVHFQTDDGEKLASAVSVPQAGKKKIWINGSILKKNIDILGLIPIVCIVPDDIDLIRGSSIIRRKFMDKILCQINPNYTLALITYEKTLKQKLAYLKQVPDYGSLDHTLLESFDQMLYENGTILHDERAKFCDSFSDNFTEMYSEISNKVEKAQIEYISNFSVDTFLADSKSNWQLDFMTKRVRKGVHRDDISFFIDDTDVRKFASQGQKKTFIYSLKFSEYIYLSDTSEKSPIMLLDDVFEKLDQERLKHLFKILTSDIFGQIFISDTENSRSAEILKELDIDFKSFIVKENTITLSHG